LWKWNYYVHFLLNKAECCIAFHDTATTHQSATNRTVTCFPDYSKKYCYDERPPKLRPNEPEREPLEREPTRKLRDEPNEPERPARTALTAPLVAPTRTPTMPKPAGRCLPTPVRPPTAFAEKTVGRRVGWYAERVNDVAGSRVMGGIGR
jgi:hypothetical protein